MRSLILLYLGPVGSRHALVRRHGAALRERGIRLVVADDFLVDEDRELFDEVLELPPPERVVESLAALERFASAHALAGVLVQTEAALLAGSLFAQRVGLRAPSPEAAHLCTNKYRGRIVLDAARVPVPRFALGGDAADVKRFAQDSGLPLVLKPIASTMGKGLELVRAAAEIPAAVERVLEAASTSVHVRRLRAFERACGIDLGCAPERSFLIESFAPGDPVETDGLLLGPEPCTFGVTEQVLSAPPLFFVEGYLLPADRPAAECDRIVRTSEAALAAVGLANAGFSIEFRADESVARVIDLNGRLGEDDGFGSLFRAATSREPMLHALELAAGLAPELELERGPHCALAYRSTYGDGIVTRVPTADEIARAARGSVEIEVFAWLDLEVHAPPRPECFPHLACALATHPSSSRAAFELARAAVERLPFAIESRAGASVLPRL